MVRTRVVVTGLGTTSPLGGDVASTWDCARPLQEGTPRAFSYRRNMREPRAQLSRTSSLKRGSDLWPMRPPHTLWTSR